LFDQWLLVLQRDDAGVVLYNIAPAMSSTRKIGSNTGGTSHSRILNEDDFDIWPPLVQAGAQTLSVTDSSPGHAVMD
jgi:metal-dependent HD superfamily phosphatase/phosphodiesterase